MFFLHTFSFRSRLVNKTLNFPFIFFHFQHVFKLEQEEYLREGIEWKMIDFYDNQVDTVTKTNLQMFQGLYIYLSEK
jgi:hypothetical protein